MYPRISQEVGEAGGQELASIVRVQCTDESSWFGGIFVEESGKGSDELAYVMRGFGFAAHWIDGFVSRMIVNEDEEILVTSVLRADKRAGNVGVD
eukprot:4128248-Pleurochrysis_carterae.AAC.1